MARKADHTPPTTPLCPRCGYDQSGAAATWTDSCPLRGICPECGLDFAWVDAMFPRRKLSLWLYEHTPGWRIGVRRWFKTFVFTWWPLGFWRSVRLEQPVSWVRLAVWALTTVVMAHVLAAVVDVADDLITGQTFGYYIIADLYSRGEYLGIIRMVVESLISYAYYWEIIVAIVIAYVAMPLCFVMLPVTMSRARLRAAHVARVAVYSLGILGGAAVFGLVFIVLRDWYGRATTPWVRYWGPANAPSPIRTTHWWTTTLDWLYDHAHVPMFVAVALVLLAVFWWFALTRYLKVPQPRITALVLVGVAVLVASAVAFSFWPRSVERWIFGIW